MCSSHGFPAQKIERQKAEEERQKAEEVGRRREARGLTESQDREEGKGRKKRTEGVEGRERKEGEFGHVKNLVYTTTVQEKTAQYSSETSPPAPTSKSSSSSVYFALTVAARFGRDEDPTAPPTCASLPL